MKSAVFICGTDTDVGKTFVTAALIRALNKQGIRTGGFKPCESGCRKKKGVLIRGDSAALKQAGDMPEDITLINPYCFEEPLAPGVAADRRRVSISFSKIKKALRTLSQNYDMLFVEGAGGLLVPVSGKKTNLDLICHLNLSVVLVARLGLGTINHTLLTLEHLKRHRIKVLGVILNQTTSSGGVAEKTNPPVFRKMGVKILGEVAYGQKALSAKLSDKLPKLLSCRSRIHRRGTELSRPRQPKQ